VLLCSSRSASRRSLRSPRGLFAVLLTLAYLVAGGLHSFCDIDVTGVHPSGTVVSATTAADSDASGKHAIADHHCHGCFSVSLPALPAVSRAAGAASRTIVQPVSHQTDTTPRLDTPPPKILT
jgi:hypothetical protein